MTDSLSDEADFLLPGETLPSPEEIAAACERIQSGWTETIRTKRWAGPVYVPSTLSPVAMRDILPGFFSAVE